MNKVKAGIMGGAGYTGGELLRLLIRHPNVDIDFVHSRSHAGAFISDVHTDLLGDTDLKFTDTLNSKIDVAFLCAGHGEAKKIISENQFDPSVKIIDLSQDFRIHSGENRPFIYGLPELNREKISKANNIANPGCFATAIQLALLPLAERNLLRSDIHITCTTGSTGAGQSLSESAHFSWRENNLSVYKPFNHQHLSEIHKSLKQLQPGFNSETIMLPQRGAFTRGILACVHLTVKEDTEVIRELYSSYYKTHPFVHLSTKNIDLKQVVNTNKCILYLEKHNNQLMIISIIDNLLKGASGQAVQNMNILFGLEETTGLQLKASAF
jgi:N-acetyl-gamma-glutamyl-phosphate reductase